MTEDEMFEKSLERPSNYYKLSGAEQWAIDADLGILDWPGERKDLSDGQKARMRAHYDVPQGGWPE